MANTILVLGATGKQGGAVINALLASPDAKAITICAVTRKPESAAAKALVLKAPDQIKLMIGDLKDCPSIFANAPLPIKRVFFVSIPDMGLMTDGTGEEVTGKALIDASLEHGVRHFVFTSVDRHGSDSDTNDTDVPHFWRKANIEKYLQETSRGSQMTWTILRPTAFMDNISPGFAGNVFPTAWRVGLPPETRLQFIALADIGHFGAKALLNPKTFAGRAISLAGDELTFEEANAIFHTQLGYDIPTTYNFVGSALLWAIKEVGLMFKFWEQVGYAADIASMRKEYPGLLGFRDWLKTSSWVPKVAN
ncbi:NAD(P)-binding protein [Mollisia scopiformis]|uniref:NAD(P)-binding protein n=1 Tax=Mollisia scopiformis TaxID=149040 RepID=A0A132B9V8_MOLSC|nr:NAD(P)-binding protein [Mollisia scopiformis]KUJ08457.1 NAD(P)-binding protein [Mollisia scopiformis]